MTRTALVEQLNDGQVTVSRLELERRTDMQ